MSDLLKSEALGEMSVEELLDLNIDAIEEQQGFQLLPVGVYTASLVGFTIPDPADEKDFFEASLRVTSVIELVEETEEENMETVQAMIDGADDGFTMQERYYRKGGFGVTQIRTTWADVISSQAEGHLGNFFAQCGEEGFELPVAMVIKHRVSKPKKSASEAEKAAFEPRTYMTIDSVQVN